MKNNIAVFASGKGTNLGAIIDSIAAGKLRAHIALVVSDQRGAFALKRAKTAGINTLYADPKKFATKHDYEKFIIERLTKEKVRLVVLAGFMRILSPFFIKKYKNRVLNIHPSLLPAFKGAHAIRDAYRYGVKVTGVTVHFVDEEVDHGPIVLQGSETVSGLETIEELEKRIHKLEHKMYPAAIGKVLSGRLSIRGRRVRCELERADHFMRLLPRVARRIVEHLRPFVCVAEAVLMIGGGLREHGCSQHGLRGCRRAWGNFFQQTLFG